jgi:hypothetical protein
MQRSVRAVRVVVLDELAQHQAEVASTGDQEVVEAFATQGADEAFGDGVRPRRPDRAAEDGDVGASKDGVESGSEPAIPVTDQEPEPLAVVTEVHEQVAGLLGHPGPGRMSGDPGDVYTATAVLDHHQDIQAAQEDRVDVGEIDGEDRMGLRGEELAPGRAGPLRGGIDACGLEDLPHRRRGDPVAEADQLALDTAVTPGRVLAGHPQDQRADRLRGGRTAWLSSPVGPAAGDEASVPAQQGSGRHQSEPAQLPGRQFAQRAEDRPSTQVSVGRGLFRRSTATS